MRVLVTGASGQIGSAFSASCEGSDLALVRADLQDRAPGSAFPFRRLDITDEHACQQACEDVDAVLHLAADPDPESDFRSSILPVNLVGTYNVATAAAAAGVRRFVFASSAHAVAGYPNGAPGPESSWRDRAAWLSPRDANQLLTLALTRDTAGHLVVHGTSDNASRQLSLQVTSAALGYAPLDDAWG